MSFLSATAERRRTGQQRGHLRMLRGGRDGDRPGGAADAGRGLERERSAAAAERAMAQARSRILVAGADPQQRAAVLRELSEALPEDTQFGEAGAAWEVLDQAPSSGVVMLAGDLVEVTAESLMNVLGHRHPSLPVVALGILAGGAPEGAGRHGRAASAAG